MRRHIHFWFTTLARGFIALFVGSAIRFVPDMAGSVLLLPMAVAFSVLALAAYGMVDSALVLLSSTMSRSRPVAMALRGQGLLGLLVGLLLFGVVYQQMRLEWFFALVGVQALCLSATEIFVAQHTSNHAKRVWNYGAAAVAFAFGCVYLLLPFYADRLESEDICSLIYGYLLAFGFFQVVTALRMLYGRQHVKSLVERRLEQRASRYDYGVLG
jgi:hypothetical protein